MKMLGEEKTLYLLIIDKVHFTKQGGVDPEVVTNLEFRWTTKRPENARTVKDPSLDGQTPGVQTLVSHVRPLDIGSAAKRFIAKLSLGERQIFLLYLGQIATLSYLLGQQAWNNTIRRVLSDFSPEERNTAPIEKMVEILLPQIRKLDQLDELK